MRFGKNSVFALLGILILMCALLVSCGGGEEPADTPEPADTTQEEVSEPAATPTEEVMEEEVAEPEPVHLTIGTHLTNEAWAELFNTMLAEYTAENPNITLENQATAFAELLARVATDRLADEPPDMYILPAWWLGNLVESGIPLTAPQDLVDEVRNNYTPGAAGAVQWEGEVYGVPFENNPTLMIYKKSALEEAGYDGPPETFDELMDYARNLTVKDADGNVTQYGWSQWVGSLNWNYLPFVSQLYSCGGDVFDEATGLSAFNSEAGVKILEGQVELIQEGVFNPELTSEDWYSGRVALTILPNWTRFYLATNADPNDYGSAPVPHCEGSESGAIVYTWFIMVNSRSDNIEEAWDFVRWMTIPYADDKPSHEAQLYYDIASIMPARYHDLETMSDLFSVDILPTYVESTEYAKAPTPYAEYDEIINIIIAEMENAWFDRKTPQEALDDAAAQADALLQAP